MSNPFETRSLKPDATGQGPLVSAVIPTRNRPELVTRAVRSALGQTYPHMEVVVVIDGPDSATEASLSAIEDDRLRIVALPESVGGSQARNVGVQAAQGEWIAFLDDDDEWLAHKTEVQLLRAGASDFEFPIVASRVIARTPQTDYVWPRRLPHSGERVAEYLFCHKGLVGSRGLIQTSTIFTKRALLLLVPFKNGLKKHQDWDWVISASNTSGTGIEMCPESLACYHMEHASPAVSRVNDWYFSLAWMRNRHQDVTRRAYAAFLLVVVAEQAKDASTTTEYLSLLSDAVKSGSARPFEILFFLGIRLVPRATARHFRAIFQRKKP